MDYEKIIADFSQHKAGEFIITDTTGKIIYRNNAEHFTSEQWDFWFSVNMDMSSFDGEVTWEISDAQKGEYYRVKTVSGKQDGVEYILHHVFNISDYMGLMRDVSDCLKDWREMSAFQTSILEHISDGCQQALPVVIKHFKLDAAVLYIGREKITERFMMRKGDDQLKHVRLAGGAEFDAQRSEAVTLPDLDNEEFVCFANDIAADGTRFALYIRKEGEHTDKPYRVHYQVLRLFLENSLLREKIIYESEHDSLTALYNKGKYLSMMQDFFPKCGSIAIYNMDVNYLKRVNDSMGHEAGDALLIKAAKSLLAVERENLRGFRMGGDEFFLIGWDMSEEQAVKFKEEWEQALEKLNRTNAPDEPFGDLECIIACGLSYGTGDFDLKELLRLADERMYENKVAIKLSRGDDPDAR